MEILPLSYLGNIQYFSKLCFDDCVIDVCENYVKQSFRTRADILSANGPISLSVQVAKPAGPRCPVREMRLDYSKRWQHQHWVSLVSAYKSSPYFDYYEEALAPFYRRRYEFLLDYDVELTRTLLRLLGSDAELRFTESYALPEPGDRDWRTALSPKQRNRKPDSGFAARPYCQVFGDKFGFVENLSVVDLIFCEGPDSLQHLKSCRLG